ALPQTVLAMVQTRLAALPVDARKLLRVASVFGEVFYAGGVARLLDADHDPSGWLTALCNEELIGRRPQPRFPGEAEYGFRHALVREAAYAMLTDEDRRLGHRLAGEWLLGAGEHEAAVLAEHFERGGEPARALGWYQRAAEQAIEGNDF